MTSMKYETFGAVELGKNIYFYSGCRLGLPKEARIINSRNELDNIELYNNCDIVHIADNSIIGNDAIIYEGTTIKNEVILEDKIRIGFDCLIGSKSRLMYGAYVCDRVEIGDNCRIAGFICDAVKIGNNSTVMGNLVHAYTVPDDLWGIEEPAPIIGENSVVGYGATVVGGVKIGNNSYVAAGTIVTKDVPDNTVVVGINKQKNINEWSGEDLKTLYLKRKER